MRELNAETTALYLRETGRVAQGRDCCGQRVDRRGFQRCLAVELPGSTPIVIKQCRERLRVAMEWHAAARPDLGRACPLDVLAAILPAGMVPEVLFEDRPNYLFAMTCAPDDSVTWKTLLMGGQADPEIAARLGTAPGKIHAEAPRHPALRQTLADTSLFDELRIDPYYRTTARAHPDLAPRIKELIASMDISPAERTLVLGDFSPKNILVHREGLDPARLRMCSLRRRGLRSGLFSHPPAAQGDPLREACSRTATRDTSS